MDFKEKRRFKRIDLSGFITITPIDYSSSSTPLKGKFKNVSEGGVLFESEKEIKINTFLKIEFAIPSNKAFAARYREFISIAGKKTVIIGKVVRAIKKESKYELGIQFVNMYEGDMANFKRFLELVDKDYYKW